MYCLRYWARYVRKGKVKSGGIKIGNESAIEPINRLIQTQSKLLQHTIHTQKIERLLARNGVLSGGSLGLNTLCRGCSSHMTLVGLLYPRGDKSETVCTGYKV